MKLELAKREHSGKWWVVIVNVDSKDVDTCDKCEGDPNKYPCDCCMADFDNEYDARMYMSGFHDGQVYAGNDAGDLAKIERVLEMAEYFGDCGNLTEDEATDVENALEALERLKSTSVADAKVDNEA